jgi:hypothetical protein
MGFAERPAFLDRQGSLSIPPAATTCRRQKYEDRDETEYNCGVAGDPNGGTPVDTAVIGGATLQRSRNLRTHVDQKKSEKYERYSGAKVVEKWDRGVPRKPTPEGETLAGDRPILKWVGRLLQVFEAHGIIVQRLGRFT